MVPAQISCPLNFPSEFFGEVFSGLRLSTFISLVSGSSTLIVFSFFQFLVLCTCTDIACERQTFLLADFGKVLCSSAKEVQQNSNATSREDYIPQILSGLLEIHHVDT